MDASLLRTPGLTEFLDPPVPEGASPYVPGAGPGLDVRIVEPDPGWPAQAEAVIVRIRAALGPVVVALEHVGREPWWYGHRMLRGTAPAVNLHVYGPESAESARQRLFRDWLREHPDDRDRYAAAKRAASAESAAAGEHVQQYNLRKQAVLRDVYARIFAAAG